MIREYMRYVGAQFDELRDGIMPALAVVAITLVAGAIGTSVALSLIHLA